MTPDEIAQMTQAQRVLTTAGILLYEPAHPVKFGPEVTLFEHDRPRLVLRVAGSPDGAKLEALLDGTQIGVSTPIAAIDRGLIESEVRAFLEALGPPLWPVPKPAARKAFTAAHGPKATGTLAARRAAKPDPTSPRSAVSPPATPPASAPDFVPFVAKKNRGLANGRPVKSRGSGK